MPLDATAGATENRPAFVLPVTLKVSVWPASSAEPLLIAVAQPGTDCAPPSSATDWSPPLVKLGSSFTEVTVIVNV